jgi:hypothetical protein
LKKLMIEASVDSSSQLTRMIAIPKLATASELNPGLLREIRLGFQPAPITPGASDAASRKTGLPIVVAAGTAADAAAASRSGSGRGCSSRKRGFSRITASLQ